MLWVGVAGVFWFVVNLAGWCERWRFGGSVGDSVSMFGGCGVCVCACACGA